MLPFITGLIAGAAVGILFAPDRGSETRKRLMSTVNNLSDSFTDTINEFRGAGQGVQQNSQHENSYERGRGQQRTPSHG
jgi:gas vesicle protein